MIEQDPAACIHPVRFPAPDAWRCADAHRALIAWQPSDYDALKA